MAHRRADHDQLHPDVGRIWKDIENLTGRGFLLAPDGTIASYANALVELGEPGSPLYVVRYVPSKEDDLPYFLAHEAGHILRYYRGPPEKRVMPMITEEARQRFRGEFRDDLYRLARKGLPDFVLEDMANIWHEGVVRQVSNFPVDMRIERWLYEGYEGLRPAQRKALKGQLVENLLSLGPSIRASTPKKVFEAAATMNCSFAAYLSWLYRDRNLRRVYSRDTHYQRGERMAKRVWETPDSGLEQDFVTVNRWAEDFGVASWFGWAPVEGAGGRIGHDAHDARR